MVGVGNGLPDSNYYMFSLVTKYYKLNRLLSQGDGFGEVLVSYPFLSELREIIGGLSRGFPQLVHEIVYKNCDTFNVVIVRPSTRVTVVPVGIVAVAHAAGDGQGADNLKKKMLQFDFQELERRVDDSHREASAVRPKRIFSRTAAFPCRYSELFLKEVENGKECLYIHTDVE